ncbi:MAG TPA: hypothetical protein VGV86_15420, partial [Acidimicrobiales bacterium]|nr:hypothetical protein [Acidimicrobiales bacterium]
MNLNLAVLLVEPAAFAVGLAVLRIPEALVAQRWRLVMAVLAVLSAAGAVAAGGTATGWLALDV